MHERAAVFFVSVLTLVLLAACGSSPVAPSLEVTSHADGDEVTGSRDVTVEVDVAGTGVGEVTVTLNGEPAGTAAVSEGTASIDVTLVDGANTLTLEATGEGGSVTETLELSYPFLALETFAEASVVIGQDDFTSDAAATSATTLSSPDGSPVLAAGTLFLPDSGNERILGFGDGIPDADGAAATFALGQADRTSAAPGTGADELDAPMGLGRVGERLYAADYSNGRVVAWDGLPDADAAPADVVLGASAFGTVTFTCDSANTSAAEGVHVTDDRVIVADSSNNRVLVYEGHPEAPGAEADLVLGQPDFTSCDADRGGAVAADTMAYPTDAWTDGTRLLVADAANNRVLVWTPFPTENGQSADLVLGAPDLASDAADVSSTAMDFPIAVEGNGNQTFVADFGNDRVLVYDGVPDASAAAADRVLGQPDFDSGAANGGEATPTAQGLDGPAGLLVTADALVVPDKNNHRALVFEP